MEVCFKAIIENGAIKEVINQIPCSGILVQAAATSTPPIIGTVEHMAIWTIIVIGIAIVLYRTVVLTKILKIAINNNNSQPK